MAVIDQNQQVTMINPRFTETFGYTDANIPTMSAWYQKAFPDQEIRRQVESFISPGPGDEQNVSQRVFPAMCRSGEEKNVVFRLVLLSDGTKILTCDAKEKAQ